MLSGFFSPPSLGCTVLPLLAIFVPSVEVNFILLPVVSVWFSPPPSRAKFMHFGLVLLALPCFLHGFRLLFWMVFRPSPLHRLFSWCNVAGFVQLLRLFLWARISWKTASFCCVFSAFVQRFSRSSQYSVWECCSALPICTSLFPTSSCLITSEISDSIGERTSFSSSFNDSKSHGNFLEVVAWRKFPSVLWACRCQCFGPQR